MPTPVGYADCSVFIKHDNDPDEWALTFGVETDLATFTIDEHAAHVFGTTAAAWAPSLTNMADFTRAVLRFGQDGADDLVAEFSTSPIAGASSGLKVPQNCACLVRKNTVLGGRKNRGRCFVPGVLSENGVSDVGLLDTTTRNTMQGHADAWFDGLTDSNGGIEPVTPMVILHSDGSTPTLVSGLTVDTIIGTQRRRLRR